MSSPASVQEGEFALLPDGGQILICPYRPVDRPAVEWFLEQPLPESRLLRFHSAEARISTDRVERTTSGHARIRLSRRS